MTNRAAEMQPRRAAPGTGSGARKALSRSAPVQALAHTAGQLNAAPAVARGKMLAATLSAPFATAVGTASTGSRPRAAPSQAPFQAKLYRGRTEIKRPFLGVGVSTVADTYLGAKQDFVLRGDCKLGDKVIHVLDRDFKYLLGESHGSNSWNQRTANWDIDTMMEREKGFPEEGAAAYRDDRTETDQPLESVHAFTLAAALQIQFGLHQLDLAWAELRKHRDDAEWVDKARITLLHQAGHADIWIGQLRTMFGRYETYAADHAADQSAQARTLVAFAEGVRSDYAPAIERLDSDIGAVGSARGESGLDQAISDLARCGAPLKQMADELLAIVGHHPAAADPARISELAGGAAPHDLA